MCTAQARVTFVALDQFLASSRYLLDCKPKAIPHHEGDNLKDAGLKTIRIGRRTPTLLLFHHGRSATTVRHHPRRFGKHKRMPWHVRQGHLSPLTLVSPKFPQKQVLKQVLGSRRKTSGNVLVAAVEKLQKLRPTTPLPSCAKSNITRHK